jgi:DNA-binding winged helix-turn-helix (wHTH) protein
MFRTMPRKTLPEQCRLPQTESQRFSPRNLFSICDFASHLTRAGAPARHARSAKLAFETERKSTEESNLTASDIHRRYRFGIFEVDARTGELRRQGVRIKLNAQPLQVLLLLLAHPGELLTREEIARALWPEGTFVDYEHGVNSAVNRIREALSDTASSPRYIETLARRGYRFLAPVEVLGVGSTVSGDPMAAGDAAPSRPEPVSSGNSSSAPDAGFSTGVQARRQSSAKARTRILATAEDLPPTPHVVVQILFLLLQLMFLGFYMGALTNLAEIEDLLSPFSHAALAFRVLVFTAAILIPVRAFMFCAVLFRAPAVQNKLLRLWPFLLPLDILWSLAPFLLLHHINFGLALACMALLVYSPFAQRSLVLMGAGQPRRETSVPTP